VERDNEDDVKYSSKVKQFDNLGMHFEKKAIIKVQEE
jgi:hypothetical protein